ncbi:MAG: hypothetical protein LW710_03410 [Burkholderiales bacterium]|jgi:hypothetical protein|uniref:hypothetical protein n=1 Tax=Limnobacter sp. TaxID=2003368 RepID=UPI0039BCD4A7|nr:hypothetical protein [Burkholderiales bacterium]
MTALTDPELIKALAAWVGQLKSPYHEDKKLNQYPVKLMSSSPNAWLEIKQIGKGMMEITCIHRVIEQDEYCDLEEVRQECKQFNSLMDRVRLPAYMWEDRSKAEFQLRWQETLVTQADLKYVQRFFEQSLYLANALQSRLGWALNSQPQPLTH